MAAAHGAGQDPMAVHVGLDDIRSHELCQPSKVSSGQRQGRSRVRIRKTKTMGSEVWTAKVWNRRYERGPIRIDSILSIYARMAPQERAMHIGWIDVVPDLEL